MYCENCGTKIPDGSQFCPECGAPVRHEEESLITRARRGDNDAIQQLMDQYRGMVRYQARMYVKNEDDVNEIEQQVYIKAFSKTSDLADEKRFGGWLKTIAINTAKDYVTSAFKKRSVMFTDLDDTNNDMVYDASDERVDHRPEVQMDETTRQEIIMKVLQDLPQDQQDVIVMHFYNDLSFKEIAEELGVPMSTVTGRAQMAKNSIKASVTAIQNRDGIKLYNLTPVAFFIWLLGLERTAPVKVPAPVVYKPVKANPKSPSVKDKTHYGNSGNNVDQTVAKETVQTTAKSVAGGTAKKAGAGILTSTAGKIAIAGVIGVTAVVNPLGIGDMSKKFKRASKSMEDDWGASNTAMYFDGDDFSAITNGVSMLLDSIGANEFAKYQIKHEDIQAIISSDGDSPAVFVLVKCKNSQNTDQMASDLTSLSDDDDFQKTATGWIEKEDDTTWRIDTKKNYIMISGFDDDVSVVSQQFISKVGF